MDLTNWKITLPIEGNPGKLKEVEQPDLAIYKHDEYFVATEDCAGIRFRAPVDGETKATLTGDDDEPRNPRSELREMTGDGNELAYWSLDSGIHTMFIKQKITEIPKYKQHIVVGQIHDYDPITRKGDDLVVIRLEYPKLYIDLNGTDGTTLEDNYKLGDEFTVKFVVKDGKVDIFYNDDLVDLDDPITATRPDHYFKAGAYTQSYCENEEIYAGRAGVAQDIINEICADEDYGDTNYGEVIIYDLEITHTDEPTPPPPAVPLLFEAEAGQVVAPMQVLTDVNAQEGEYVANPNGDDDGRIEYTVVIPETGNYVLYSRVIAEDGGSNSINYAFDGGEEITEHYPSGTTTWTWIAEDRSVHLTAGEHTLTVFNREIDTRLDAFELKLETDDEPILATEVFQAEAGIIASDNLMEVKTDADAQEGQYVVQTAPKEATPRGQIDYTIEVPETGEYTLHSRVIVPDGSSNSIYYAFDGADWSTQHYHGYTTDWEWRAGDIVTLTEGVHSFTIWNRESNTQLDAFQLVPTQTLAFEAESGTVIDSHLEVVADATAQGGEYIVQTVPKDMARGQMEYTISILEAGTYTLRSRVIVPNGSSNSIYYAFDSAEWSSLHYHGYNTDWEWKDGPEVTLTAGTHTLTVWNRESNTQLDAFELIATN